MYVLYYILLYRFILYYRVYYIIKCARRGGGGVFYIEAANVIIDLLTLFLFSFQGVHS